MNKTSKLRQLSIYIQNKFLNSMNQGRYQVVGEKVVNLASFMDHKLANKNIKTSKKVYNMAFVLIKNQYDISYPLSFVKHNTCTFINVSLLSRLNKERWYSNISSKVKSYGDIDYLDNGLYVLVPAGTNYQKEKIRLK